MPDANEDDIRDEQSSDELGPLTGSRHEPSANSSDSRVGRGTEESSDNASERSSSDSSDSAGDAQANEDDPPAASVESLVEPDLDSLAANEASIARDIEDGNVDLHLVVKLAAWRSPRLNQNTALRRLGERYYMPAAAALRRRDPRGSFAAYGTNIRAGAALQSASELAIVIDHRPLTFDWTPARDLLARLNDLDGDIRSLLRAREIPRHRGRAFSLVTNVLAAIDEEAGHHPLRQPHEDFERRDATEAFKRDIEHLNAPVTEAEDDFAVAAQRISQLAYGIGMLAGLAAVLALTAVAAYILHRSHVKAWNGIAAPAGALGASVSVLRRLTAGDLTLDIRAERWMIQVIGGLRPVLGAIFGMAVFCLKPR
jgi:hypothetical protein